MGLIKMYARPIKYKVNGPGTEETADGFVASPVRYSTISVEDLADHISADSRVERSKVAVITDSLIKQIREMVLNGHKIIIPHLGSFKPKIKSNLAINPESVDAASFTAKVQFTPSVELKRDLQASRIEKTTLPTAPEAPTIEAQKASLLKDLERKTVAAFKKLYPEKEITVKKSAFEIGGPADNRIVIAAVELNKPDGDPIRYGLAYVKAKDPNAMGNYYEYFHPDASFVSNLPEVNKEGYYDQIEEDGEEKFVFSNYKVTEPFTVEEPTP